MSEAVDLADGGRKTPVTMPWRAARRSREARVKYWRAFAVSAIFLVVLGANLYFGAAWMFGTLRSQNETDRIWAASRTARIIQPLLDGTFCRTIVYDNKSAHAIKDKVARCDAGIRKGKGTSEFNWGGH